MWRGTPVPAVPVGRHLAERPVVIGPIVAGSATVRVATTLACF